MWRESKREFEQKQAFQVASYTFVGQQGKRSTLCPLCCVRQGDTQGHTKYQTTATLVAPRGRDSDSDSDSQTAARLRLRRLRISFNPIRVETPPPLWPWYPAFANHAHAIFKTEAMFKVSEETRQTTLTQLLNNRWSVSGFAIYRLWLLRSEEIFF